MTSFETVYEQMLINIEDYQIKNAYEQDYPAFVIFMVGLIKSGIAEFTGCLQSLTYSSKEEVNNDGETVSVYYFDQDLTIKEISILSKIVLLRWWERKLQTTVAFQGKVPVKDFKQMEISDALKQKSMYKDKLKEEISYDIEQYQLSNLYKLPFWGGVT